MLNERISIKWDPLNWKSYFRGYRGSKHVIFEHGSAPFTSTDESIVRECYTAKEMRRCMKEAKTTLLFRTYWFWCFALSIRSAEYAANIKKMERRCQPSFFGGTGKKAATTTAN